MLDCEPSVYLYEDKASAPLTLWKKKKKLMWIGQYEPFVKYITLV